MANKVPWQSLIRFLVITFSLFAAVLPRVFSSEVEHAKNPISVKMVAPAAGRIITVNTTNNANPPAGSVSLLQALTGLQAGDIIRFNIPGAGPHFIETPVNGYPLITASNVTIDGYSQPGSLPNTNLVLEANTAQIRIVLDSRNGNVRLLDFDSHVNSSGYGDTEAAVLGIYEATNVRISGLSILSIPWFDNVKEDEVGVYGISFAKGASGQVSGNWIGIAPDGTTLAAPKNGITGFQYRSLNTDPYIMNDGVVVGVKVGSTNAPAEFNVFCGIPSIPVILEGSGTRICGNFFNVYPSGLRDFNPPLVDPINFFNTFEGNIEIGRSGNNTVIGVDGDGVNDINERNVFSGVIPKSMGGYDHNIEFYSQSPGTNIIVAGNWFGIGVDINTRFTNGVPALNASGSSAQYRFGTDWDGVGDEFESNVVFNNWPTEMFPTSGSESFFDELSTGAIVSARNNYLVNNFPFPVSPLRNEGQFLIDYYTKALVDPSAGVVPVISPESTGARLIATAPVANPDYPVTIIDLYEVDPEGIAYGQTAGLPNGYVQSRWNYLGAYIDNSPADANPAPGQFSFDISRTIASGRLVTISATYSKSTGTRNAIALTSPFSDPFQLSVFNNIRLSIGKIDSFFRVSWQGGKSPFIVLKKNALTDANWSILTTTSARFVDVQPSDARCFFLIRNDTP